MAVITTTYAAAATVTITPASVANAGYRQSAAVDNATSVMYDDCHVGGLVRVGTLTATGSISIFAYGSYDGTEYTAGLDGADSTITWGTTGRSGLLGYQSLPLLGNVPTDATDDDDYVAWGPFSIAAAFGGVVPRKWGIVILNSTGASFQATQTSSECQYSGITFTST